MFEKKEGVDYFCNFYRSMLYDSFSGQYLITLDDGRFLFLNSEIFTHFKKGVIYDEHSFSLAKEKGLIITPDNIETVVENIRNRYKFLSNGTSLHIVVPTIRCNQSCPYCFAEPKAMNDDKALYDMDEEVAKQTIRYIMNSPSKAITIEYTGGEATARFDLIKLMTQYAEELNLEYKKDLRFSVVTNLTLMTDEIAEYLIEHNIQICTSLDGPEVVHDANRIILGANSKKIGTYNLVKSWIEKINQKYREKGMKHNYVAALMTITRYSFEYYREILDLYAELGIYHVDIRAMMYIGNATTDNNNPNEYGYDEFKTFYKNCLSYIKELNSRGIPMEDRMRSLYYQKIYENTPSYHVDFESPWGGGTGSLTYSPRGEIYACHESIGKDEFRLGSIFSHKWKDLFKTDELASTVLTSMLESNPQCDRCVFKPYCGTSPIENLFSQNKFHFFPPETMKHHETLFHCYDYFNKEVDAINKSSKNEKLSTLDKINNNIFDSNTNNEINTFMDLLYEHLSNKNIDSKKRNIILTHSYEKNKFLKNRIIYHCYDISQNDISEEIKFIRNISCSEEIFSLVKYLLEKNLLPQYYISIISYEDNTIRTSFYFYLTKSNRDIIFETLAIDSSLYEEFMKASLIGIDEFNGEISNFKIYKPIDKNTFYNSSFSKSFPNINTNGIYLATRYSQNFEEISYKLQLHYHKNDMKYYSDKFNSLITDNSITIIEFGYEFDKQGEIIKQTCYYSMNP